MGENIEFDEIKGSNSPYPEFEWQIHLYSKFSIKLDYDRSTLSISVPTKDGYKVLSSLTNELVFGDLMACNRRTCCIIFKCLIALFRRTRLIKVEQCNTTASNWSVVLLFLVKSFPIISIAMSCETQYKIPMSVD